MVILRRSIELMMGKGSMPRSMTAYSGAAVALAGAAALSVGATSVVNGQSKQAQHRIRMVAVQLLISDYDKWRSAFDGAEPLRKKAGITTSFVYRNADNPNEVLVWNETVDVTKTRDAIAGPEIARSMREAGVVGPPRIHVVQ